MKEYKTDIMNFIKEQIGKNITWSGDEDNGFFCTTGKDTTAIGRLEETLLGFRSRSKVLNERNKFGHLIGMSPECDEKTVIKYWLYLMSKGHNHEGVMEEVF